MASAPYDLTPDLCDNHPEVRVLEPMLSNFGGREPLDGVIATRRGKTKRRDVAFPHRQPGVKAKHVKARTGNCAADHRRGQIPLRLLATRIN